MRILVCLADDYRSYREVIAVSIQILRPRAEVVTASLDAITEEVRSFDPHLVICSEPVTAGNGDTLGWVELSMETSRPTVVCVDGRCSEQNNPTLEKLLSILDEVEQLI